MVAPCNRPRLSEIVITRSVIIPSRNLANAPEVYTGDGASPVASHLPPATCHEAAATSSRRRPPSFLLLLLLPGGHSQVAGDYLLSPAQTLLFTTRRIWGMFWRGFLDSDPRITFTTSALTGRKKILPQNPLSSFSESLNFAFQDVGLP